MATSKFFSHSLLTNTNEQFLVQSMVNESMQNFGMDVQYLPRSQANMDTILNDAERSSFTNAYTIEVYMSSVEGFGGSYAHSLVLSPETPSHTRLHRRWRR